MGFYRKQNGQIRSENNVCEIYVFIDPLCAECWALEPLLKKLHIEYGAVIKIRYVLSAKLKSLNASKANLLISESSPTPYYATIAIKAAELQGKRAGLRFLRKFQEMLFIEKQNVTKEDVLLQIASETDLDVNEFQKDFHSESAIRAYQCDMKITNEMEVDESPTLVFFNGGNIEEEGIKVTGGYPYKIYVHVLTDVLGHSPEPAPLPSLLEFIEEFKIVTSKEIAFVYEMEEQEVEYNLKKLMLKQKVEVAPAKFDTFWRYVE